MLSYLPEGPPLALGFRMLGNTVGSASVGCSGERLHNGTDRVNETGSAL